MALRAQRRRGAQGPNSEAGGETVTGRARAGPAESEAASGAGVKSVRAGTADVTATPPGERRLLALVLAETALDRRGGPANSLAAEA